MTHNRKPVRTRSASNGPGISEPRVATSGSAPTIPSRDRQGADHPSRNAHSTSLRGQRGSVPRQIWSGLSERGAEATRPIRSLPLAALIDPALALGVRINDVRSLTVAALINRSRSVAVLIAAMMFAAAHPVLAQSDGGYVLKKSTVDGGGHTFHEGGGYRLGGTIGQHDAGDHAGGGYVLTGGFWTPAAPPPVPNPGACCDHDSPGGCLDDRMLDECVCGTCEWFQERTCAQIDCTRGPIPTVSEWGLVILTLLLLTGAKIYFGRPKVAGP